MRGTPDFVPPVPAAVPRGGRLMDVRFVGPDELRIVTRSYEEDHATTTITARIDRRTMDTTESVTDCLDYES